MIQNKKGPPRKVQQLSQEKTKENVEPKQNVDKAKKETGVMTLMGHLVPLQNHLERIDLQNGDMGKNIEKWRIE